MLRFLARSGARADWFDARPSAEDLDLAAQFGFVPGDPSGVYSTVIAAPGVPIDHPDLETLRRGGAEIIGEVELAARARPTLPMVGVTGTAGKGSTTVLIAALLRACGLNAREGGNIDPPLLDVLDDLSDETGVAVVELSSFQLERVVGFAPMVAVITNLATDHLDRHGSLEAYHAAKLNITRAQTEQDWLVLPQGLNVTTRAQVVHFSSTQLGLSDGTPVLDVADLPDGIHPANAAAALLAAEGLLRRLGRAADSDVLAAALRGAQPVGGRFETVARRGELRFVNDSIATRTLAVEAALLRARPPIAWLVGGRDKGAELEPLRRAAAGRVSCVVGFGEDGEKFARALGLPFVLTPAGDGPEASGEETMRRAVGLAVDALGPDAAHTGGTVLLSPIGTSFDLFRDYAERGELFRAAALEMAGMDAAVPEHTAQVRA